MKFFDKEKLTNAFDKAKDLAGKATDAAKTGIEQAKTTIDEKREKARIAKLPQEGGLKRYEVTYRGGHPLYDVTEKEIKSYPYIIMDVMPDRFSFLAKELSEKWFKGFELPYPSVVSIDIIERTMSNVEAFLGSGSNNNDLRQDNVLEITYEDGGDEFVLRVEMLTGTTVMGQARVCKEMMDLLRTNKILKQFKGSQQSADKSTATASDDIVSQIEKLAKLKDQGILTEEEFSSKKAELLGKL